jgi:hypothetical protein
VLYFRVFEARAACGSEIGERDGKFGIRVFGKSSGRGMKGEDGEVVSWICDTQENMSEI